MLVYIFYIIRPVVLLLKFILLSQTLIRINVVLLQYFSDNRYVQLDIVDEENKEFAF